MQQKNKVFNFLGIILLLISFIHTSLIVFQNKALYLAQFDGNTFKKAFEKSQWRVPNSTHPISDQTLYSYAGYRYAQGENPILVNPEAPPLGKYLIGISIMVFSNEKIINVFFGYSSLILIFGLTYFLTRSLPSSSIAVFLTSINSLFVDQLINNPQLEIIQLFFLLLFIFFFLLYERKSNLIFVLLSGISLGCFFSIKAFTYHILLILIVLFLYVLKDFFLQKGKLNIKKYFFLVLLFFISCFTYIATYFGYFLHNGTIRGFFGVQKWIFLFYQSSGIDMFKTIGSYLSLIFINRWRFWTKDYPLIPYESWNILWPFIFAMGSLATLKLIKNKAYSILVSFFVTYNLFLLFTPLYPRYLLLLFVVANILIAAFFDTIIHYRHEKRKK